MALVAETRRGQQIYPPGFSHRGGKRGRCVQGENMGNYAFAWRVKLSLELKPRELEE